MNPRDSQWLRQAFRKVAEMETEEKPSADGFEIKITVNGTHGNARAGQDVFLVFYKDGEAVASAPITNADWKRVKRDLEFVKKMQSRSAARLHG